LIGTLGFDQRKGDVMDDAKEGFFGLPHDLFFGIVAFLQAEAAAGTAASAAALAALASLAKEEHAAAAPKVQPRTIDVVFKALELKADLDALVNTPTAGLPAAIAAFGAKLDNLAKFWNGQ
jgi:hypothetical protein